MEDTESRRRSRTLLWMALLSVGLITAVWVVQQQDIADEEGPRPVSPYDIPEADEAPPEDEIEELDNGPLHRPPGTAPADIRRPATVPYDNSSGHGDPSGREESEEDEGRTEEDETSMLTFGSEEASVTEPEESQENEEGSRESEADGEGVRQARRLPAHLEGRDDEEGDSVDSEEGDDREITDRQDGSSPAEEEDEWREAEQELLAERERALSKENEVDAEWKEEGEEWKDDVEDNNEGEWEEQELAGEEQELAGEDEEVEMWEDEEPRPQSAPVPIDERAVTDSELRRETSIAAGENSEHLGERGGDLPPTGEALEDYQDFMDEAGTPDAMDAGMYSAMGTQQLADVLYRLSAGRTLPDEEASRQRDDLVGSVRDSDAEDEPEGESDVDDDMEGSSIEDFIDEDEEWTTWLDAADWLRFIQEEEYPELGDLVDEVEDAAQAIDPDIPEEEQINELMDFFEAVEVVLEAMALEGWQRPEI